MACSRAGGTGAALGAGSWVVGVFALKVMTGVAKASAMLAQDVTGIWLAPSG